MLLKCERALFTKKAIDSCNNMKLLQQLSAVKSTRAISCVNAE
jgi:hypothetical protein